MLRNLIYRITYGLFIVFFLLGAVFYRQSFLAILTILLCILPILSIFLLLSSKDKISPVFKSHAKQVTVTNTIPVSIGLNNQSYFPFLNCSMDFTITNGFYSNDNKHNLSISALPRKINSCVLSIETGHSGMMFFQLNLLTITDPLHLYTIKIPANISFSIPVFPKKQEKDFPLFLNSFLDNEDDEYLSYMGQPSRDLKEIREYRPGDKLTNIHWKMTAKKDEILVKEFEQTASRSMVLLTELSTSKLDDSLSTLYSYMLFLLKNNEIFRVCMYNHNTKECDLKNITNAEEAVNALLATFYLPSYEREGCALEAFNSIYGDDKGVLLISGNEITEK